jgi:ubiquinone biosynthesis protein
MMTVEGVARRIDPQHDIWAAADPVVRRWMTRELSPLAQAKRLGDEALATLKALRRRLEEPPAPAVAVVAPPRPGRWPWVLLGAALAAAVWAALEVFL